jgi:hypothetical protein
MHVAFGRSENLEAEVQCCNLNQTLKMQGFLLQAVTPNVPADWYRVSIDI